MHGHIKLILVEMKNTVIFFLLVLISFSCWNRNTKEKQVEQAQRESNTHGLSFYTDPSNLDILLLNDKAVKLIQEAQNSNYDLHLKDSLLKEALANLDLAIKKDSNFYNAYLNMSTVYRRLGQYNDAIKVLEELLNRENHPEALFVLGIIYEKQGNQKLANRKYKEAYNAYQEYLELPISTARDEMNKDYVLLFLEGKESVLNRITQKLTADPGNKSLISDKNIIEQFNRTEFISSF